MADRSARVAGRCAQTASRMIRAGNAKQAAEWLHRMTVLALRRPLSHPSPSLALHLLLLAPVAEAAAAQQDERRAA